MSFHNLTSSSPRFNEPENTIYTYTKTKLNEDYPFISVNNKKISAKPVDSKHSAKYAMEQYYLISCVVNKLYDQTSLISFSALELSDQTIISSSSSDSIKSSSATKLSAHADHQLELYFSNMDSNIKEKKIEAKAKVILAIAKEIIFSLVDKNFTKERFARNALANALSCHADLYIKPLTLTVDPCKIKRKLSDTPTYIRNNSESTQKNDLIKKLHSKTFEALMSYWLSPETELKKSKEKLLKNVLEEDKKIVNKHFLFNSSTMAEVLQEHLVRLLITPGSIGSDIRRHMPYIQIKGKNTGQEYIRKKPAKTAEENPAIFFDGELENFKRMINFFLSELSKQNAKDLIIQKIDQNSANAEKTVEGLDTFISSFLEDLHKSINDFAKLELNLSARNLYYLLLTLAQTPYLMPAQPIIAKILKNYKLKIEEGRFFSYEFENNIVKLCITVNMSPSDMKMSSSDLKMSFSEVKLSSSEVKPSFTEMKIPTLEHSKFKIELKNTLTCTTKDTTLWSSEISLNVELLDQGAKDEVEKNVVAPLQSYGFKVTFSSSTGIL